VAEYRRRCTVTVVKTATANLGRFARSENENERFKCLLFISFRVRDMTRWLKSRHTVLYMGTRAKVRILNGVQRGLRATFERVWKYIYVFRLLKKLSKGGICFQLGNKKNRFV